MIFAIIFGTILWAFPIVYLINIFAIALPVQAVVGLSIASLVVLVVQTIILLSD